MAQGVTPTGITNTTRVEATTHRKIHAKVVDNVLSSRTYWARLNGMGKSFTGKTFDIPIKVTDSGEGEFYTGLETLNSAASDTVIELSYAHTGFAQPVVSILLESFANSGPEQAISLDQFKLDEAVGEATQKLGTAAFSTGTGDQPMGLGGQVDDGTDVATIGGQSRTTFSVLDSTRTASGGTLSLSKLATLHSAVSAAGIESEEPNIGVTTKTVWDLYEQLLSPQVRASYASVGFDALPVRASTSAGAVRRSELKGASGFTALSYRGIPIIKDDAATAQNLFLLNEKYLFWAGRTSVPEKYRGQLEAVNLGTPSTTEGVMAAPTGSHGWFFQKLQMMPNQAGMIGRYHVVGQIIGTQPRRQGRLTGITGV